MNPIHTDFRRVCVLRSNPSEKNFYCEFGVQNTELPLNTCSYDLFNERHPDLKKQFQVLLFLIPAAGSGCLLWIVLCLLY